MRKFTKALTLATATMLLVSSVTGCSNGNKSQAAGGNTPSSGVEVNLTGYPIVEEPIQLTAFAYGEPGNGDWDDYPV